MALHQGCHAVSQTGQIRTDLLIPTLPHRDIAAERRKEGMEGGRDGGRDGERWIQEKRTDHKV